MAKLTGPLFSMGAHGSIGAKLTIRRNRGSHTAVSTPTPTGPASQRQLEQRQVWRNARAQWHALPAPARAAWTNTAVSWGLPAFALWAREYALQQCEPPTLPQLPAGRWSPIP